MNDKKKSVDKLITSLQERAKELNCLYCIDEILKEMEDPLDVIFSKIIEAIPPGWQYPDVCQAKNIIDNKEYYSSRALILLSMNRSWANSVFTIRWKCRRRTTARSLKRKPS